MPIILLVVLSLLIPFNGFSIVNIGDYGVEYALLPALFLVTYTLVRMLLTRQAVPAFVFYPALTVIGAAALSLFAYYFINEFSISEYVKSFLHLIFYVVLFLCIASIRVKTESIIKLLKINLLFATFICLYGFYQVPARFYDWPFAYPAFNNVSGTLINTKFFDLFVRPSSIFLEPSFLGAYLIDAILVIGICMIFDKTLIVRSKYVRSLMLATFIGMLFCSFSIGAFLVLAMVACVMFVCLHIPHKWRKLSIGTFTLLGLLAAANFAIQAGIGVNLLEFIGARFSNIFAQLFLGESAMSGDSLPKRFRSIAMAFQLWTNYPLTGVGIGNYGIHASKEGLFIYTDSALMSTMSEQGLVGILAYVALFGVILVNLFDSVRNPVRSKLDTLKCAFFFVVVAHAIELSFNMGSILHLREWFPLGLAALLLRQGNGKIRHENSDHQPPTPISA